MAHVPLPTQCLLSDHKSKFRFGRIIHISRGCHSPFTHFTHFTHGWLFFCQIRIHGSCWLYFLWMNVYCVPSTSTCVCLYVSVVVLVLSIPATSSYDDVRLMWPVQRNIFWQWNSLCNQKLFCRSNFNYLPNSMEKRLRITLNVKLNGHRMTLGYVSLYTLSIR